MSSATETKALRILVVENHEDTLESLKLYLEDLGHEVRTAMTLDQAVQNLIHADCDVLICDIGMPDGTGWDLLARLCEKGPVRAIAFSAFDEPEHVARSEAAGFLEHFVKGSPAEDLVSTIRKAVAAPVPPVTRQPA